MKAFIDTRYTKQQAIQLIHDHIEADALIAGSYWDESKYKGCHIGCLLHSNDHSLSEPYYGISQLIFRLLDSIHEGLPEENKVWFFENALPSIPEGVDDSYFDHVWNQFAHWLLVDEEHGVLQYTALQSEPYKSIQQVATLYLRRINGEIVNVDEFQDAADAAAHAATIAATYAADSAVAHAADAARAARAATYAATYAAADAADAASAASAARVATYTATYADSANKWVTIAEQLINLLSGASNPRPN